MSIKTCNKCILDGDSHFVRKDKMTTFCGKKLSKETSIELSIEIVTCDKCTIIYISKGEI
jgi:hypothetical protein